MAEYDKWGREIPDDTPVEIPVHLRAHETLEQKIARMVRTAVSQEAEAAGFESFEEANDFSDEDEEDLPPSEHELRAAIDEDSMTYLARLSREDQMRSHHDRLQRAKSEPGVGSAGRAGKSDSADGAAVGRVAGADSASTGRDSASGVSGAGGPGVDGGKT